MATCVATRVDGQLVQMRAATLEFCGDARSSDRRKLVFVGRKAALLSEGARSLVPPKLPADVWEGLVSSVDAGDDGDKASTMFLGDDGTPATVVAAVLPEACSRHASPVRPHALSKLVAQGVGSSASAAVIAVLDDASYVGGAALAIGRAFPFYQTKTSAATKPDQLVSISFADSRGTLVPRIPFDACAAAATAVRRTARIVDVPPDSMSTTEFVKEARATAARLEASGKSVSVEVISGEALRERGYGMLWAVGKAAEEPPALVVLSHVPEGATETVALVGKGIVYDTGGLSLKSKEAMPTMKCDCGGAAAVMSAFEAAVAIGSGTRTLALHCVLCLAENAIGPGAVRNDDIVRGLSGRTVEINNTDAEGRLVLGDGVAHCTAIPPKLPGLSGKQQPDTIIEMATLTGAQMIATGMRHAGVVASHEALERAAVRAGLHTGDMVHPLPFCPEFYRKEFESKVAEMKNSVKNRNNAQSSCAATFIYEHLHPEYTGGWLHVDLAGPAWIDDRGTGFGVGLALGLLGVDGFEAAAHEEGGEQASKRARTA